MIFLHMGKIKNIPIPKEALISLNMDCVQTKTGLIKAQVTTRSAMPRRATQSKPVFVWARRNGYCELQAAPEAACAE
ncbi:hypothetical protein CAP31_05380 [Sulfuriferula sp. AH1]|nr:hypothetical protein CAP31_05380 [Sulfuriferula sp. AH1]